MFIVPKDDIKNSKISKIATFFRVKWKVFDCRNLSINSKEKEGGIAKIYNYQ